MIFLYTGDKTQNIKCLQETLTFAKRVFYKDKKSHVFIENLCIPFAEYHVKIKTDFPN